MQVVLTLPNNQPASQPKNSLHRSISSTKHHQLILIESRSGASANISQTSFNRPNLDSCREESSLGANIEKMALGD